MLEKNKKSRKIIALVVLFSIISILILLTAWYFFILEKPKPSQKSPASTSTNINKVDYSPPTEKDKNLVNSNKEDIVKNTSNSSTSNNQPSTKKSVLPTITYAGVYDNNIEVGSYVSEIFEDGGICTATFTLGSISFTKNVTGIKNVSSVNCPVIQVPKSQFSSLGAWNVKVSYDSITATGVSATKTFEVR